MSSAATASIISKEKPEADVKSRAFEMGGAVLSGLLAVFLTHLTKPELVIPPTVSPETKVFLATISSQLEWEHNLIEWMLAFIAGLAGFWVISCLRGT